MIYLENNLEIQEVWIPKNENSGHPHHSHDYEEGYADGVRDQKAKVQSMTITENGTYTNADGFSPVIVDVPQGSGYEDGFRDGRDAQKREDDNSLTPILKVSENGSYEANYGYKKVEVNVPQGEDAKLQEKSVFLSPGLNVIEPDEGYDGMYAVRAWVEDEGIRLNPNNREVWIEERGKYFFSFDSSVSVDDFIIHFGKAPMEGKYMTAHIYSENTRNVTLFNEEVAPYIKTIGVFVTEEEGWVNIGASNVLFIQPNIDYYLRFYFYDEMKVPANFMKDLGDQRIEYLRVEPRPNAESIEDFIPFEEVGDYAFSNVIAPWDRTAANTIFVGAKRIGSHAFDGFKAKDISFTYNYESVGEGAFHNMNVKKMQFIYAIMPNEPNLFNGIAENGIVNFNPQFTSREEIMGCAWWPYLESKGWAIQTY